PRGGSRAPPVRGGDLRRLNRSPLKYLLVELPGRGFGFCSQLALQRGDAHLILLESGAAPTLRGIEVHQRPMHGLLQRIEGQQPYSGLNPAFGLATARLLGQQLAENLQRKLPQSLALYGEPLLERRLVHVEAFDEIAAVQARGLLQGAGGTFDKQALEGGYIDIHRGWIECNGPASGHQDWRSGGRQCFVED